MAREWRQVSIGALCDAGVADLQTGPFGSQLHAYDYMDDGVPVVPTEAIRGKQIDHSVLPKITPSKAQELRRHRLRPGDILFARRGVQATGHIGCVREAENGFICGTGAIRLRVASPNDEINSNYLSHVLADSSATQWFKFHAIGATMPNLNEGIIRSFPLSLPPIAEQGAIAHILGTLDDKIELNWRMSETLEAMARALFRSWFVDFDPVRAKMECRDTSLPKPFADLFPARMVESELGEIPDGWEVGALNDLSILNPETWTRQTRPTQLSYLDLSNTKWGRIEAVTSFNEAQAPSRAQRVLRPGDTIVGTVRPGNGSYAFITDEGLTGSTGFAVLRPTRPEYAEFVYLAATARENIDALAHLSDGGAYPAIRAEMVSATQVVRGSDAVEKKFAHFTRPLFARIAHKERESRRLVAFRDALLPKLISGELRVRGAEKFVEKA